MEGEHFNPARLSRQERFIQRRPQRVSTALGKAAPAGMVHRMRRMI